MLFSLQGSGTSPPRFAVADSLFIHEMGLCLLMSESPKTSFKWFNFPDNCSFTWSSVNQQTVIQSGLTTSLTKYLFLEECHAIRSSSRSSSHCNEMVRNARKAKRGCSNVRKRNHQRMIVVFLPRLVLMMSVVLHETEANSPSLRRIIVTFIT